MVTIKQPTHLSEPAQPTQPRIAIDAVPAAKNNKTGVEWYVYHLIRAMNELKPELDVVLYTHKPLDFELKGSWKNKVVNWPFPGWKWWFSRHLLRDKPDVLFVPGDALPPKTYGKVVTTVHDLAFVHMPKQYSGPRYRTLMKAHKRAASEAERLIAISHVTKQDMVDEFGASADSIKVIPLAYDDDVYKRYPMGIIEATKEHLKLPKRYFLSTGRLDQRKGQADLIRSFLEWRMDRDTDIDLVLVGGPGKDGYDEIHKLASESEHVYEAGYVAGNDLGAITAGAEGYVTATKKEGFGIPIIEAMACAVPVACSDLPTLREVGGESPVYVSQSDRDAWIRAFDTLLDDGAAAVMIQKGLEIVKQYSWERTAKETLDVLCDI